MKMYNIFCFAKKIVSRTLSCFALITIFITAAGTLLGFDELGKVLWVSQLRAFLLFAFLYAVSFGISDFIKNNIVIKRALQFVLTFASALICVFCTDGFSAYVAEKQNPAFSILAISFAFVIVYVICALAVLIGGFIKNKLLNANKEYESLFLDSKK